MRMYKQGREIRVCVNADEVEEFNYRWPCSELTGHPISFTFASNGDLVDTNARGKEGGDALLALSQDAWKYAEGRMKKGRNK